MKITLDVQPTDSATRDDDLASSHWLKTCPVCSRRCGHKVWLPYPDAFGVRKVDGKLIPQSHCRQCRHAKPA